MRQSSAEELPGDVSTAKRLLNESEGQYYQQIRHRADALDTLVIKTDKFKHSEVSKAMMSGANLVDFGVNIRSTCTGEMIIELMRDRSRKGAAAHKYLAGDVLGEGVEVRACTAEGTLMVNSLYEITVAEEIVTALRQQCKIQMATSDVRLQNYSLGHRQP